MFKVSGEKILVNKKNRESERYFIPSLDVYAVYMVTNDIASDNMIVIIFEVICGKYTKTYSLKKCGDYKRYSGECK